MNCSIGDISYGWGKRDTAGTHRGAALVLTNTKDYACRLTGYLTINAVPPTGPFVPAKPTKSGYLAGVRGALPVIVLAPDQSASAYVEALSIDPSTGKSCGAFREFDVTLPGDATAITVTQWTKYACADLQVHPLVAGKTGRH